MLAQNNMSENFKQGYLIVILANILMLCICIFVAATTANLNTMIITISTGIAILISLATAYGTYRTLNNLCCKRTKAEAENWMVYLIPIVGILIAIGFVIPSGAGQAGYMTAITGFPVGFMAAELLFFRMNRAVVKMRKGNLVAMILLVMLMTNLLSSYL